MAKSVNKYSNIYVSKLRPNSINAKKVLQQKLAKPLTSRQIVAMLDKKLGCSFKSNGRMGTYLIYKATAKPEPYYYTLSISK